MKILSITSGYPDKEYRVKKIFAHEQNKEFQKQGCEINVINLGATTNITENFEGIDVLKVKKSGNNLLKIFKNIQLIKKHLKSKKFDLVLFNGLAANQYFYLKYFKSITRKTAIIVHGTDGMLEKSWLKNYLKRRFLKKVDYIFPVSHYTDTLVAHLEKRTDKSAKKSKVVYNGINPSKFSDVLNISKEELKKEFGIKKETFVILTVCDLIERKGIDILIKAVAHFSKKNKDFLHIIIGKGDKKASLIEQAKQLNIIENIKFIDYIEKDEELVKYYKLADVYSMLSKTTYNKPATEGFGISYIEASYLGVPVIGGNNGGTTTAVQHNFTGFLVDPYSEQSYKDVSNYLNLLKNNREEYNRLSKNGIFMVEKEFTWKKNVEKILKLIKS